jgi:thiamine-phosphate pyrophosphorylase
MDSALLRLLDANANRAREGLRVVEDYVRFVLGNRGLSADLKDLRHELAAATRFFADDAIYHRDTPGDVGTTSKTEQELARADVQQVVIAAGKRLGEAMRAIGEYLKVLSPEDAAAVERLRYRFYSLEQQIAFSFRADERMPGVQLYVLITASVCRRPWLEAAEEAILGGADCIQLREKELEGRELLDRARRLVAVCRGYDIPCIINDRVDIALLSDADGVHVGQADLPAREVRRMIGRQKILGVSTHNIEQARQAVQDGADYIGVGPFFRSPTKPRDFTAGPEYAREVAKEIHIPSVAIAGITLENIDQVLETGIRAVAVTAAAVGQSDTRGAAAALKAALRHPASEQA